MEIIIFEDRAFWALIEEVVKRLIEQQNTNQQNKWLPQADALKILNIRSKTTLCKLRNQGMIEYSQPQKKVILYNRDSLLRYIEKHKRNTF